MPRASRYWGNRAEWFVKLCKRPHFAPGPAAPVRSSTARIPAATYRSAPSRASQAPVRRGSLHSRHSREQARRARPKCLWCSCLRRPRVSRRRRAWRCAARGPVQKVLFAQPRLAECRRPLAARTCLACNPSGTMAIWAFSICACAGKIAQTRPTHRRTTSWRRASTSSENAT